MISGNDEEGGVAAAGDGRAGAAGEWKRQSSASAAVLSSGVSGGVMSCGRVLVSGVPERGVDAALPMPTARSSRPNKGLGGARSELESESTKPAHDGGICRGRPEEIDRGVRGWY